METIVSVVGLAGVLALNYLIMHRWVMGRDHAPAAADPWQQKL